MLVSGLIVFSSCTKKPTVLRRVGLAPANVLIGDAGTEWLKVGAPLVLQQDLMSSQFVSPAMLSDESHAAEVGAQDILRLKLEEQKNEKIEVTATLVDVKTQKTTATEDVTAPSMAALIPALDKLAKKFDPSAGDFSTKNIEALKLLTEAGGTQKPQERLALLQKAQVADPNFGMAYFMLVEMMARQGPDALKQLVTEAKSHMANFPPYEKARFQLFLQQLDRAPLSQRTATVENLLKVAPNDLDALQMIGNVRFLNGDADGGVAALNKAIQLNPNNLNYKTQLAQGLVQNKRFADAEKVLAKFDFDKNPGALAELATTILLEGDVKRATETADRFIAKVPNPDLQGMFKATWAELIGDHAKAISLAENTKFSKPEVAGMTLSEATVWQLLAKDYAGARKTAELTAKSDNHPTAITVMSSLLVSGDQTVDEWQKKVEASPMNPAMKQTIVAYGLFLNGHYPEAEAEWKKAYDSTEGADLRIRAMYAACLDRQGKTAEAQKVKVQPFLIRDLADVYGVVAFSEMRRLTGLTH